MGRLVLTLLTLARLCLTTAPSEPDGVEILERDVVVIGGGSSGTNVAIRLQQQNKTVALLEKQDILGGHVDTYIDPTTGASLDYGVVIFDGSSSAVRDYLASLNIATVSVGDASAANTTTVLADFAKGSAVSVDPMAQGNASVGFQTYLAELAKYPFLNTGYNLPSPVPEDLLLTFGKFAEKYNLGSIVYILWQYLQGVGNILDQRMLYVFKYAPAATILNIGTGGFITSASHNNQEIYNTAQARLGDNAFVSAKVTKVVRSDKGVQVWASTPKCPKLIIKACKLVISIPPKLENLEPFLDLTQQERSLFSNFNNSYYWDIVLKNAGLPANVSVSNLDPAAPYGVPASPSQYVNGPASIPGLRTAWYSSPFYLSDEEVKSRILADDERLAKGLGYHVDDGTKPEFVGFNAHNPFELTVSNEAIEKGFYTELESLQGQHNTWWTGATWQGAHDSSQIWRYNDEKVLPGLLRSL